MKPFLTKYYLLEGMGKNGDTQYIWWWRHILQLFHLWMSLYFLQCWWGLVFLKLLLANLDMPIVLDYDEWYEHILHQISSTKYNFYAAISDAKIPEGRYLQQSNFHQCIELVDLCTIFRQWNHEHEYIFPWKILRPWNEDHVALKSDQLLPRHNRKFHPGFAKIKFIVYES